MEALGGGPEEGLAAAYRQLQEEHQELQAQLRQAQVEAQAQQAAATLARAQLDRERGRARCIAQGVMGSALAGSEAVATLDLLEAQRLAEERGEEVARLQAALKREAQRAAQKRTQQRQKLKELAEHLVRLQRDRATAVRICEDNRALYERRLAELGHLGAGLGSGAASSPSLAAVAGPAALPAGISASYGFEPARRRSDRSHGLYQPAVAAATASRRVELRAAVAEHLARNAEWLSACEETSLSPAAPAASAELGTPSAALAQAEGLNLAASWAGPESLRASRDSPTAVAAAAAALRWPRGEELSAALALSAERG
eukprot:CAMPEP_0180781922 /NCGR_PEP_ID=MMETSP1038_2-20121128/47984_1 /TAXON_ID=632150 /ORGANISM="Azadinium spinosum, Strain 3D9" /LENGTH=315 /DNA_ID=CAMNT_0022817927 /DNA_START=57 /DNA_END=1004 /DNA_ORIENTATION=+